VVVLFAVAFFVSRGCQRDQVRVTKDQAIAAAKRQIEFTPTRTQIRLLRQGIQSRPYWIVSLSIPRAHQGNRASAFKELAVVRVEANTGKVADVKVQR
jgi:hypothetical protein